MKNKKKFPKFDLFVKRRIFDHKTFHLQHGCFKQKFENYVIKENELN